ncbi:glycosyl transferase family 2 [Thiocapsa marina 5811]|uniref:Glycosyl transferase family 2 n=2 Tax=Thiocapsa marina TaxID=244573 RepID=F9UAT7_9GAMM|nr:glycosyl transferase family 2 [Thiocapsa marina 5811]
MPSELETDAQEVFEFTVGGFARGFLPKRFTASTIDPVAAANVGAGANMAFRRDLLLEMGLFARELDVGTPARAAGDTYAFFRVLDAGYTISYNPRALVWHRHRRDMQSLISTLRGYNVGTYVFLLRCLLEHRDPAAIHAGLWWLRYHLLRNLWRGIRGKRKTQPLALTLSELCGLLDVPRAYIRSVRREQEAGR